MQELKELAYIINRYQVRYIDVLTNPDSKPAKTDRREWDMYIGIRDGRFKTEEDAATHFGMDPKGKQFNRLKNSLKDKLMDTLLFLDTSSSEIGDFTRRHQELIKHWNQTTIILRRGGISTFIENAFKCLKTAIDLQISQTCVEICRELITIISSRPQYHNELDALNKLIRENLRMLNAECSIHLDYDNLIATVSRKKGYKKGYALQCSDLITQYKTEATINSQPGFQIYYRLLSLYSKTFVHDWANALVIANDSVDYCQSQKYVHRAYVTLFLNQKISCLFMLEQYEVAKDAIMESLKTSILGNSHWFKTKELSVANAMYAEWYDEAWETVQTCMQHERFVSVSTIDQESWRLYYGYLSMLASRKDCPTCLIGKIDASKFRLQAWLNDLPLFSTDKRGSNIPILLLQVHFLLIEGQHDLLLDRVEALRKYRQRNLDPDSEHYRSDLMIRLIELLIKYINDLPTLLDKATEVVERMEAAPADILDRSFEIEIVPYPRQWAWMVAALGTA